MVKAVIFDMYETLITLHAAPLYFSAEMAADAGIPAEDFRKAWYPSEMDRTLGKLDLEAALTPVLQQFGCCSRALIDLMVEKRKAAKRASFDHIHPEILPMLQALREKDMKIGLITNCFWEEAEYIRASELFPYFDAALLSCEVGLSKPDEAIYRRCTEMLGVAEAECLYIGDGGSRELETAQSLGMKTAQAVWYLKEGTNQPTWRKPEFTQAETPMGVLRLVQEGARNV